MKSLKSYDYALIAMVVIGYLFVLSFRPNTFENNSTIFSIEKAREHLKVLAKEPHPIGSKAHETVFQYIMDQGVSMGFEMESVEHAVQSSYGCTQHVTVVKNIHAWKKGTDSDGIIVFAAHYDSQPNTPGAADDAQAVAAFLTNMEKIQNVETKNDILFLITDAEETGLNGAKAFVEYFDRQDEIKYVFNFEARGNSGPVFAFETSDNNYQIVSSFRSLPHANRFTSSLMYEVYKLLPNDTDFTIFKRMNIQGISMANIDGFVNYHSMTDNPANINSSTFYHHGLLVHDLLHKYKDAPLMHSSAANSTYFNLLGPYVIVQYPPILNLVFLMLSLLLLFLYARKSIEKFSLLVFLKNFLLLIAVLAGGLFAGYLFRLLLLAIYPNYENFYSQNFYNGPQYFIPFAGIMALVLIWYLKTAFQQSRENYKYTQVASLSILLVLGAVSFVYIKTASYIFVIPVFAFLLVQLINTKNDINPWIDLLAMIIPIALFIPFCYMFFIVFSLRIPYAAMLFFIFCFFLITPLLSKISRLIPMLLIMLVVLGFIRAHSRSSVAPARPYQAQIHYEDDIDMTSVKQDINSARIVNNDERIDFVEMNVVGENKTIIPAPLDIFSVKIDTIENESEPSMKRIAIELLSDDNIIRIDTRSDQMSDWQKIIINDQKISGACMIRFLGNVEDNPMKLEFSLPLSVTTDATITTYQRGLLDNLDLGPTIIPGTGYYGGTILHKYRFTW